jgi:hypothetical protein
VMTIVEEIERFRRNPSPPEGSTCNPFKLVSSVREAASIDDVRSAWQGNNLPCDALDFWAACREARLFEDVEYGQWGLALLSPSASATRTAQERIARPFDVRIDDVVLGAFLGDQELLVIAPSETGDRRIMIALPLDGRADWFGAAPSLAEFLADYFVSTGDKYWEHAGRNNTGNNGSGLIAG